MPSAKTSNQPPARRALAKRQTPIARKTAAPQPAEAPKPRKAGKEPAAAKPPKTAKLRSKPVRDSFTMPQADFALIAALKARTLGAGRETKKSELLRAGLHVLASLDAPALLAALNALAPVKVGRPKSGR
jgi:hypothetical protein